MIDGIKNYILENELKITILNNKINIVNYIDIDHFDSNKIIVKTNIYNVIITGVNLVVSKLMNDEILITGDFNNVEFR